MAPPSRAHSRRGSRARARRLRLVAARDSTPSRVARRAAVRERGRRGGQRIAQRGADGEPDRPHVERPVAARDGAVDACSGSSRPSTPGRRAARLGVAAVLAGSFAQRGNRDRDRRGAGGRRDRRPTVERALRPAVRGAPARRGEPRVGDRLRPEAAALERRAARAVPPRDGEPRGLRAVPQGAPSLRERHRGGRPRGAAAVPARDAEGPALRRRLTWRLPPTYIRSATGGLTPPGDVWPRADAALRKVAGARPGQRARALRAREPAPDAPVGLGGRRARVRRARGRPAHAGRRRLPRDRHVHVGARAGGRRRRSPGEGAARGPQQPRDEDQPGRLPGLRRPARRGDRPVSRAGRRPSRRSRRRSSAWPTR